MGSNTPTDYNVSTSDRPARRSTRYVVIVVNVCRKPLVGFAILIAGIMGAFSLQAHHTHEGLKNNQYQACLLEWRHTNEMNQRLNELQGHPLSLPNCDKLKP